MCSGATIRHPSPRLHLPSATCPSYGMHLLISRIPPASTCQSLQASQSEASGPTDASSWPKISVIEARGSTQPDAAAQAFFSRSLLRHATLILIYSFLVLPAPKSRFRALMLAEMTDKPLRSDLILLRPVDPSPSPPSLPCLLPYSRRCCQFAPSLLLHPAILCRPLFTCRTSCLRVRCIRLFSCHSTFLSTFFTHSP